MVIGQCSKAEDIELNVCKKKHLTNTRSSSADEALTLVPPRVLSLEQAIDFIDTDELLEVTPRAFESERRFLTLLFVREPVSRRTKSCFSHKVFVAEKYTVITLYVNFNRVGGGG